MEIRAVRLQAPATNSAQDYVVSGFGAVQAAIILGATAGSDGSDVAPMTQSFGFWDTTNTVGWSTYYEDAAAVATAGTRSDQDASNIVEVLDGSGVDRSATISAQTNGVTLTWSGTTANRPYITVILINDINGAQVGASTPNASDAGTTVETTTGLTPKVIFGGQNRNNVADGAAAWATASFGFAYDNGVTIDQYSIAWNFISGASQITGTLATDRIASNLGSSSRDTEQEITAMASGSFTQTTRNVDGSGAENSDLYYLALDYDDGAAVFQDTTPQASGDWSPYTGGSITPSAALILATYHTVADVEDNGSEAGSWGVYVATSGEEYQMHWNMEDAAATNSNTSSRTDVQLFTVTDTAGAADFTASSPTFGSGSMTFASANVSPGSRASIIAGIAFEAPPSGSIAPIVHHRKMLGIQ